MPAKRTNGENQPNGGKNGKNGKNDGAVTREEFDEVLRQLEERGEGFDELRRDVLATCRHLEENVRRELQTQFTRIVQLQQEIDALKRRA